MGTSLARWRKTFWIATAMLALSLLAAELGIGAVATVIGLIAATIAGASFIALFVDPGSRQPHIR